MLKWVSLSLLSTLPQLAATFLLLPGGTLPIRLLALGLGANVIVSRLIGSDITAALFCGAAGYALYTSYDTVRRTFFGQTDFFGLFALICGEASLVACASAYLCSNRSVKLPTFFAVAFLCSVVFVTGVVSFLPRVLREHTPFVASIVVPLGRVALEIIVQSGLDEYDSEGHVFSTGFGVSVSTEVGSKGLTLTKGSSYAQTLRRRFMYVAGTLFIGLSMALPILFNYYGQFRSMTLVCIVCPIMSGLLTVIAALLVHTLKNGRSMRSLDFLELLGLRKARPAATATATPAATASTPGAAKSAELTGDDALDSKEEKLRGALLLKPQTHLVGGIKFIFTTRPSANDALWFLMVTGIMLIVSFSVYSPRHFGKFCVLTVAFSFVASRSLLSPTDMSILPALVLAPLLNPFYPLNTVIFLAMVGLANASEGKDYLTPALSAVEILAAGVVPRSSALAVFLYNLAACWLVSLTYIPHFSAHFSALHTPEVQSKYRNWLIGIHISLLSVLDYFPKSRVLGIVFYLCLLIVAGLYCHTHVRASLGDETALKVFVDLSFRAVTGIVGLLLTYSPLDNAGLLRRVSLPLYVLAFSVSGLITLSFFVDLRRVHVAWKSLLSALSVGLFAALFFATPLVVLVAASVLTLSGMLNSAGTRLSEIGTFDGLCLVLYNAFYNRTVSASMSSPPVFLAVRWLTRTFSAIFLVSACAFLAHAFGFLGADTADDFAVGPTSDKASGRRSRMRYITSSFALSTAAGSFTAVFLLSPGLLYTFGADQQLTLSSVLVVCALFLLIALLPTLLFVSTNVFSVISIAVLAAIFLACVFSSAILEGLLVILHCVLIFVLPDTQMALAFVVPMAFLALMTGARYNLITVTYPTAVATLAGISCIYLAKVLSIRECVVRRIASELYRRQISSTTFRVKLATGLHAAITHPDYVEEEDLSCADLKHGMDYPTMPILLSLKVDVYAFIVMAAFTMSLWNFDSTFIMLLPLVTLLIPIVQYTADTRTASGATLDAVVSISGYLGVNGISYKVNDYHQQIIKSRVLYTAFFLVCARALFDLVMFFAYYRAKAYQPYLWYAIYDSVVLILAAGLSVIPLAVLTGRPYGLYRCLFGLQRKKLLASILVFTVACTVFCTNSVIIFFSVFCVLSLLFEANNMVVESTSAGPAAFKDSGRASTNFVGMAVPEFAPKIESLV